MSDKPNSLECNTICWGIAAAVGVVSMVMLYLLSEFSALQAIFSGGLIGLLLGVILSVFVCRGQKAAADLAADEKPAQRYAREAEERKAARIEKSGVEQHGGAAVGVAAAGAAGAAAASASSDAATDDAAGASAPASEASSTAASSAASAPAASASSSVKPSAPLAGEAELAERKGEWKYEGEGDNAPSDAPVGFMSTPAAAEESATEAEAASETPASFMASASAEEEDTSAATAPAEEAKPELYDAPPAEGADDLKLISGVGPKLEGTLNEMGIYRFAQVAVWGPSEIAWVDARLRFKGRIERDDWMSQAKILAEGGETEFSKRNK